MLTVAVRVLESLFTRNQGDDPDYEEYDEQDPSDVGSCSGNSG